MARKNVLTLYLNGHGKYPENRIVHSETKGGNVVNINNIANSLGDAVHNEIVKYAYKHAEKVVSEASKEIRHSELGFHSVTGQLRRSITLAILGVKKGSNIIEVKRITQPFAKYRVTRLSLGNGDHVYDLDTYADGTPVGDKPYSVPKEFRRGEGAAEAGLSAEEQIIKAVSNFYNMEMHGRHTHYEGRSKMLNKGAKNLYTIYAFEPMPYAALADHYRNVKHFQDVIVNALRNAAI